MDFNFRNAALGGGLMGALGQAFGLGGGDNYGKMQDVTHKYYDPYYNRGTQAGNVLEGLYGPMATDPGAHLEKLMEGYKPSAGYQQRKTEMLGAAGNTAAAGGIRGTEQDQLNQSRMVDRLLGEDMQQYLNNVMNIQGRGLQGEQGFYNTGYNAGQNIEQSLNNILGSQQTENFQNRRQAMQLISDILKAVATGPK